MLLPFFLVALAQEALGGCKNMILLLPKHGHYLRHHSVQNISDVTEDVCQMKCYVHATCMSYNYCTRSATCEINDSDHNNHRHDLVRKAGSVYRATDNACKSNPCPSNASCQPNFYTQSYSCLCHSGYSGPQCTDIDECATSAHNCSADSTTCVNTEGSFECICTNGYKMFNNNCIKIFGDYVIDVYTADVGFAGTDAKVFIKLHGSHFNKETSSEVQLSGAFNRRSHDTISVNGKLLNMEVLSKITMRHDGTGSWPGWYFKKVIVDNKIRRIKYTFTCDCKLGWWPMSPLSVKIQPTVVERY